MAKKTRKQPMAINFEKYGIIIPVKRKSVFYSADPSEREKVAAYFKEKMFPAFEKLYGFIKEKKQFKEYFDMFVNTNLPVGLKARSQGIFGVDISNFLDEFKRIAPEALEERIRLLNINSQQRDSPPTVNRNDMRVYLSDMWDSVGDKVYWNENTKNEKKAKLYIPPVIHFFY